MGVPPPHPLGVPPPHPPLGVNAYKKLYNWGGGGVTPRGLPRGITHRPFPSIGIMFGFIFF